MKDESVSALFLNKLTEVHPSEVPGPDKDLLFLPTRQKGHNGCGHMQNNAVLIYFQCIFNVL